MSGYVFRIYGKSYRALTGQGFGIGGTFPCPKIWRGGGDWISGSIYDTRGGAYNSRFKPSVLFLSGDTVHKIGYGLVDFPQQRGTKYVHKIGYGLVETCHNSVARSMYTPRRYSGQRTEQLVYTYMHVPSQN